MIPEKAKDFVDALSREQLIRLATGEPSQVQAPAQFSRPLQNNSAGALTPQARLPGHNR